MKRHICVVAGDVSGEAHAADVVRSLKKRDQNIIVSAVGGERLRAVADRFLADIVHLHGFGFFAPFRLFLVLWRIFRRVLLRHWDAERPDVVLLVDYYGFNIHVARAAHARGIPVLYYVSPQVWASRPGRIRALKKYVTRMLVILPFEENMYAREGVPVTFVGNPLLDRVSAAAEPSFERPHIGLFPGSRSSVCRRHIPLLMSTAALIHAEIPDAVFSFFVPSGMAALCAGATVPYRVITDDLLMKERGRLAMAITTSGTVSVENALLGIPMAVMYRLSWFNYVIARLLVTVRHITMVNILARREIVPEFIQIRARPSLIARYVVSLLKDRVRWQAVRDQLFEVRAQLGVPGVSDRVARIILETIPHDHP